MPTSTFLNDREKVEDKKNEEKEKVSAKEMLVDERKRRSAVADSKEIVSCDAQEKAIKKRYGKEVKITGTYEMNPDATYKEVTLRVQSPKNNHYVITEHFRGNNTDYVMLYRNIGDKTVVNKFDRYLDAEVTLADLIAEE